MIELLLIILAIELLVIGITICKITKKNSEIFQGYLHNTTLHTFRKIRYGKAKDGELVTNGHRPPNCAVFICDDVKTGHININRIVCELID